MCVCVILIIYNIIYIYNIYIYRYSFKMFNILDGVHEFILDGLHEPRTVILQLGESRVPRNPLADGTLLKLELKRG